MRTLILASTSPYRRALLERLGLSFEVVKPGVDEHYLIDELPAMRARRLALAKAEAVAAQRPEAIVIGSDQVASCEGRILDKPGDTRGAIEQLEQLSGCSAAFYTACALIGRATGVRLEHVDTTRAVFRALQSEEIGRYVELERPFDCAGSFKSEGAGIALLERIETADPTALIGLPLIWLAGALRRAGFAVP
jgi:septum formation protein